MTDDEARLECLKLATEHARREATTDLNRVAELQTWFYNRVKGETSAEPEKADGRRKPKAADKPPEIFR